MTDGGIAPDTTTKPTPGRRRAERTPRTENPGLGMGRTPRLTFQSRRSRRLVIAATLALALAWLVWFALTPEKLPTSNKVVSASGVTGAPIYVGMYAAPDDFDRTIRISGVKVHATSNAKMKITPMLCRRGTVGVTTQPAQFCADLVNPEGQRMTSGDSVVLKVEATQPALAVIDRIEISYREDIRWDTQSAGNQQAIVTIAGRD